MLTQFLLSGSYDLLHVSSSIIIWNLDTCVNQKYIVLHVHYHNYESNLQSPQVECHASLLVKYIHITNDLISHLRMRNVLTVCVCM